MHPVTFAAGDKSEVRKSEVGMFCPAENPHSTVESVSSASVHPSPPTTERNFQVGDFVEVFQANGGWRKGKLLGFCDESRCNVLLQSQQIVVNVAVDELRPCFDWIRSSCIAPSSHQHRIGVEEIGFTRIKFKITCGATPTKSRFNVGEKVEVRSDEKGYEGAWYAATIIAPYKYIKFIIEYENLITEEDETILLQEIAKEENISPYPHGIHGNSIYKVGHVVDAWYNEGWWEGVISVVDDPTYTVYFATAKEELMYQRSDLRPHKDWIDGNWISSDSVKNGVSPFR